MRLLVTVLYISQKVITHRSCAVPIFALMNSYNYLFHFNHYEGFWYAFKREDHAKFFNGELTSDQYVKGTDPNQMRDTINAKSQS